MLFGAPVLSSFSTRFAGAGRGDAKMFAWLLAWWPHAVASGINPFFSHAIWYPSGIDLASVTGILGPSLLMAPVTSLFGPIAAGNVLTVLAPALAGLGAFVLGRRLSSRFWPALAGGYLFGFGSYEIAQLRGHVNLYLVFPVPFAVYLFVRRVDGSIGHRAFVALFALTVLVQFSISNEVVATSAVFGGLALVGTYLLGPEELRPALRQAAIGTALAAGIATLVVSPYLYWMATGTPLVAHPLSRASSDVLSFVVPSPNAWIGGAHVPPLFRGIGPNPSEDGAYLGPGIVGLLVVLGLAARRDRALRLLLLFAAVAAVASLGPELHVAGRAVLPLPWAVAEHVPLLRFALPERFTMYLWLAIGLAVVRWLDRTPVEAWKSYGIVAISAAFLFPNLADPTLHRPVQTPTLFEQPGEAERLAPPGHSLLILHPEKGQDMLWQAEAGFTFAMPQGHDGAEPTSFRRDPVWKAIRDGRALTVTSTELAAFLRAHGVSAVVVDRREIERWSPLLVELGLPFEDRGRLRIYFVPPRLPVAPLANRWLDLGPSRAIKRAARRSRAGAP